MRKYHQTTERGQLWKRLDEGWIKLNFDGASIQKKKEVIIGGVYRNHEFAERIGNATNSVAELVVVK